MREKWLDDYATGGVCSALVPLLYRNTSKGVLTHRSEAVLEEDSCHRQDGAWTYGGHRCLVGGTGAASFIQPQVMANSSCDLAEHEARYCHDRNSTKLSIIRPEGQRETLKWWVDKYFCVCERQFTAWQRKVQHVCTNDKLHHHSLPLASDEIIPRCFNCVFKKLVMGK